MNDVIEPPAHPQASLRRTRRISIIWLVPLVAMAIGAWLAWDTVSKQGPTITISFESAEGLQPGQSQLKFKDIVFGTVKAVTLTADQSHVLVSVATTKQAEPLLTDQTTFWVVKPRLFAGSLSGLDTLLSGAYIGMLPKSSSGKSQTSFTGHEDPPVLEANVPGHTFLVKAGRLGSISLGSPVFFRDLDVGQILGWDIGDMADNVTLRVFVRAPFDSYVNDDTRFWNASGFSVKLGGAGVDVQVESLRAMLLGGIAFETPPDGQQLAASGEDHLFPLFADRETANAASYSRKLKVISYFAGSVRGLAVGSEVTMHGLTIGHVTNVRLLADPKNNIILAPVEYEVEPERIIGIGAKAVFASPDEAVATMLSKGLRASLQATSLITGEQMVALEFSADAPLATVSKEGEAYVLPTSDSGGLAGLQSSATDVLNKINSIPFADIGNNLNGVLKSLNNIANGAQLQQTLTDLSHAVAKANDFVGQLEHGATPALQKLPDVMSDLQKTLNGVSQLTSSINTGYGDNTKFNRDLERLLAQIDEAVRSFRSLADVLTQHPEALIKGRPSGDVE